MPTTDARIADNYQRVLERIQAACQRCGRTPASVKFVAVTKSAPVEWIRTLVRLGVTDLGESRPQQLVERASQIPDHVVWHLVGHLQRNKVRPVLPIASWIHSIDSVRLLDRVEDVASQWNLGPRILLEVNLSGEASKGGFTPNELAAEWQAIRKDRCVRVDGLMTMAPLVSDPEATRPVFRGLRELCASVNELVEGPTMLSQLSMGMSNDFEVAIEEGATMIRVGSRLFEGLTP